MYNKKLFKQAGLDPEKAPDDARGVRGRRPRRRQARRRRPRHLLRRQLRRLRGLHLVADRLGRRRAGHERRRHEVAAQQRRDQGDLHDLARPGRRRHGADAGLQERDRPDLDRCFPKGKIGIMPMPGHACTGSPTTSSARATSASRRSPASRAASRPSSAATASASPRTARTPTQAWNFLAWLESDDAQVEVVAKDGNVVSRTDLANNKYTAADPRLVTDQQGRRQGPDAVRPELRPDLQRPAGTVARRCSGTRCSATRARSTRTTTRSPRRCSQ